MWPSPALRLLPRESLQLGAAHRAWHFRMCQLTRDTGQDVCSCWDPGNIDSLPGSGVRAGTLSPSLPSPGARPGHRKVWGIAGVLSADEGRAGARTRGPPGGRSLAEEMRPHHRGAGVQPTAWPCPHRCPSMKPTCLAWVWQPGTETRTGCTLHRGQLKPSRPALHPSLGAVAAGGQRAFTFARHSPSRALCTRPEEASRMPPSPCSP